jgi:tetraprenyl-beta-curcumene synthase
VRRETRHWHSRAERIPDPVLRARALAALEAKKSNVEGAAAFDAFAPRTRRGWVVRAQVAFQATYDYLDSLSEMSSAQPIVNARQLHQALLTSLAGDAPHPDYYAHHPCSEDGGYLRELSGACRRALAMLPAFAAVLPAVRSLTEDVVRYQSLNRRHGQVGHRALERWARTKTRAGIVVRWWETAASAGSSLGIFASMAAAARPTLAAAEVRAIEQAYSRSIDALHSLLDHVVDEFEDVATGQRNLMRHYGSPEDAAGRLRTLAREAMGRTSTLPSSDQHAMILATMAASYLAPPPSTPTGPLVADAVLGAIGRLATASALVFRAKRSLERLKHGTGRATGARLPEIDASSTTSPDAETLTSVPAAGVQGPSPCIRERSS